MLEGFHIILFDSKIVIDLRHNQIKIKHKFYNIASQYSLSYTNCYEY